MKQAIVGDDMIVGLEYTLALDDGEVIDSSDGRDPLSFLQGRGQIIRGLEQALYGMAEGDEKQVIVAAADGYGEVNQEEFQQVPRDMFPPDLELSEGMGLRLIDQQSGQPVEAYVEAIEDDGVVLDFNHPLAGETLHFAVKVVSLREATGEEISHGHAH